MEDTTDHRGPAVAVPSALPTNKPAHTKPISEAMGAVPLAYQLLSKRAKLASATEWPLWPSACRHQNSIVFFRSAVSVALEGGADLLQPHPYLVLAVYFR